MATTFNFRSVVFKRAYRIVKETGCTFSTALVEAWARYRAYKSKVVKDMAACINSFDYDYHFNDDYGYYGRWTNISNGIRRELLALPPFFIAEIAARLENQKNIKVFI